MQISLSNAAFLYQRTQENVSPQSRNRSADSSTAGTSTGTIDDPLSLSRRTPLDPTSATQPNSSPNPESQTSRVDSQSSQELTSEELQEVQKLKERDAEVRSHEMAHLAAAGQYAAGGPTFTYQNGPDGKRYAVGGEVPIDISKEPTPEATIAKMRVVRRAALAPAEPSAADRQIAAQAAATESQAVLEKRLEQTEEQHGETGVLPATGSNAGKDISIRDESDPTRTQDNISPSRRAMMIAAYEMYGSLS